MRQLDLNELVSVRTEGGLLPAELLQRIAAGDPELPGLSNADYLLEAHERLRAVVNDAWNSLKGSWAAFRDALQDLPADDPAIKLTRDRWLFPLFHRLDYGRRLPKAPSYMVDGRSYSVSHHFEHVPIHLLGCRVPLDQTTQGVGGGPRRSPHGMMQELLNRSDDHLWAFVTNGYQLRILRDHQSLSRQAYVEFDLESIFQGDQFSEFLLLWLVCHQSRVRAKPAECWLERWFEQARQDGVRALDRLRDGVQTAIERLGAGFLAQPSNSKLREVLTTRQLDPQDYYRELLRLVYRLIFLFVAEDREVDGREALLDPAAPQEAVERYREFYSTDRLRRLARRRLAGGGHVDLWRMLRLVMEKLSDGYAPLALPGLDGYLFSSVTLPNLADAELSNESLLDAVWAMDHITEDGVHRRVNWRHMGSEELGSVYEALLELVPVMEIEAEPPTFLLDTVAGNERKTTGSFYTPSSLVDCLLNSALDPVLDEAALQDDPESAILALKVCDPACGSGHFLVAAARRIAARLAAVRAGEDEPSPTEVQHALRDVVGRCLYGVDINPMAIELCKVSLWMEALEPGRPLSFLDHHLQVGNSLLGATPALLDAGIPDGAFKPIEGDVRAVCTKLKRINKQERESRQMALDLGEPVRRSDQLDLIGRSFVDLASIPQDEVSDVRAKEAHYRRIRSSTAYEVSRFWADAWCAAFVWPKTDEVPPLTEDIFRKIEHVPEKVPDLYREQVRTLADQYQFLHLHLAFPEVFRVPTEDEEAENPTTGLAGGFDVVLGNPPWDRVKIMEKEWFATRSPGIAQAKNAAARRRKIAALDETDPILAAHWRASKRHSEGTGSLLRHTGRYPLCGRGDVNTYSVFAELNRQSLGLRGRCGCIVPSGIATDATTRFFFNDLVESESLIEVLSFWEIRRFFPGTDSRDPFALLSIGGAGLSVPAARLAFDIRATGELDEPGRTFTIEQSDLALLNPNTRTCPIFRSQRDAEITKSIYKRVPVFRRDEPPRNPWSVVFRTMFHLTNDAKYFKEVHRGSGAEVYRGKASGSHEAHLLPLLEAKLVHHFDHRYGDYRDQETDSKSTSLPPVPIERKLDAGYTGSPRYWVNAEMVDERLDSKTSWLLAWRDICRSGDQRTAISTILPAVAVGNTLQIILINPSLRASKSAALQSCLSSFVFDYCARQKVGGTHLTQGVMAQLPVPDPALFAETAPWDHQATLERWLLPRVLELTYTAWDLQGFAEDCGYDGPPFRWSDERRFEMRCELDAALSHLYGIERDDVDYIMDTFATVERKDTEEFGEYRTKLEILDIYDRIQRAIDTSEPYQTVLDPPPADSRVTHPLKAVSEMARSSDGTWSRPGTDPEAEEFSVLAAVLKTSLRPIPIRQARLTALLATSPELLSPLLAAEEAAHWQRLIGAEAESTSASVSQTRLPEGMAWGTAVKQLRGIGALIEDLDAQTWAPGQKLAEISTLGWPSGRVGVVMEVLRRREAEDLVKDLPQTARTWIDAKAA